MNENKSNVANLRKSRTRISMVPLEILVGMARAWKKDVFSGPSPVFCGGMNTFDGAIAPALAGAATYNNRTMIIPDCKNKTMVIQD